ncbi:MAG: hypothetical protein AB7N71_15280, partial [Phycisphaerae bacterium]
LQLLSVTKDSPRRQDFADVAKLQRSLPDVDMILSEPPRCGLAMMAEPAEDPQIAQERREAERDFDRVRVSLGKEPLFEGR